MRRVLTKTHPVPNGGMGITASHLMLAFGALFLLNLLLRVFYIRYDFVNGDEGVRALTATRMLEGARLYADVVTDKPPGASLFYAAVFAMFGPSMKAVHATAIVWNFATSVVVYLIAARFYNKRTALWAMLLFIYFSTNYFTQDMMAANTELLMALPYAGAFYFFMVGNARYVEKGESSSLALTTAAALVAAGLLSGLAAMFKQIGVLNLGFFALYTCFVAWRARTTEGASVGTFFLRLSIRLLLVGVGFALVLAALVVWLESIGTLGDFWRNGIVLNRFYIDSEPLGLWIRFMSGRGLGYLFFNATLWLLAAWAVWRSASELTRSRKYAADEAAPGAIELCDMAIAVWALVSLVGVVVSGRLYGHYFIPALPALSLLAARGSSLLAEALSRPAHKRKAQAGVAALTLLFLPGFFRCHHRTGVLAYETVTGTRTRWSGNWGMTKREQEAEVVSDFVRARIPAGEPLYIWGYAHDVFWRTGCRPASRYLTPYYIDGRFADAEATVPASGQEFRREAAASLLEDLRRSRPRLILDVEGGFKALPHAELVEFIEKNYRDQGSAGPDALRPFRVLQLNEDGDKDEHAEGRR